MINKKGIMIAILICILAFQIGCTPKNNEENNSPNPQDNIEEEGIMEELDTLSDGEAELIEIVAFIDENISLVSKENASMMLNVFEKEQKENLESFQEKFYNEEIQAEIFELFKAKFNLEDIKNTDNENLKNLLSETDETGFKVETAEGMFFPIINYEFYKKYSNYVTEDIKSYIDIMAVESNEVPAKDAALVIGWDEVVNRALSLEQFITQYPESLKINEIKLLYKNYVRFTLYGLNNTPLFSYDSKLMDEDAKAVYMEAIDNKENSKFVELLTEYLNVLEENDFQLTDEVGVFREEKLDSI